MFLQSAVCQVCISKSPALLAIMSKCKVQMCCHRKQLVSSAAANGLCRPLATPTLSLIFLILSPVPLSVLHMCSESAKTCSRTIKAEKKQRKNIANAHFTSALDQGSNGSSWIPLRMDSVDEKRCGLMLV